MQQRRKAPPQLANLSLGQKIMAFLSLIGLAVVGFFTAGVVLSIVAIIFCIAAVLLGGRWIWCKVTGKPFIPGMQVNFSSQGPGPFQGRAGRPGGRQNSSADTDTIDGEFHEVQDHTSGLENSEK